MTRIKNFPPKADQPLAEITKKWFLRVLIISLMFAIMPVHTFGFVPISQVATFVQKFNTDLFQDQKEIILNERGRIIDEYFTSKDMPLSGFGYKMALEADRYGLDWRLLPALAIRESTGGKFACKKADYNPFGYGSCRIDFDSIDHAIERVAQTLAGMNAGTAHLYKDKTTEEKLNAYNPPSIVPKYTQQVLSIMNQISPDDLG